MGLDIEEMQSSVVEAKSSKGKLKFARNAAMGSTIGWALCGGIFGSVMVVTPSLMYMLGTGMSLAFSGLSGYDWYKNQKDLKKMGMSNEDTHEHTR